MAKKKTKKKNKDGWFFTKSLLEEIHESDLEDEQPPIPLVAASLGANSSVAVEKTERPKKKPVKKATGQPKAEPMVPEAAFLRLQDEQATLKAQLAAFKEQEAAYQAMETEYLALQLKAAEEPKVSTATMVAFQQETKEQMVQLQEDNEALSQVIETNSQLSSEELARYRQELAELKMVREGLETTLSSFERQLVEKEEERRTLRDELLALTRVHKEATQMHEQASHEAVAQATEHAQQLAEMTTQTKQLNEELVQLTATYEKEKVDGQRQMEATTHQAHDFNLLIDALEAQVNTQGAQLTEAQATIADLQETIAQQTVLLTEGAASEQTQALQERIHALEEQVILSDQQVDDIVEENDLLTQAVKKLLASNEAMREALETQETPTEVVLREQAAATATIQQLQATVETLEKETARLEAALLSGQHERGELMLSAQEQANQLVAEAQQTVQDKLRTAELALAVIHTGAQKIFMEVDASRQQISAVYGDLETIFHQIVKGEATIDPKETSSLI